MDGTGLLLGAVFLLMFLAPVGTLLLIGLTAGAFSSQYQATSCELLRNGAITGAICAAIVTLFLIIESDFALPGAAHYIFVPAAFLSGLAATIGILMIMRRFR